MADTAASADGETRGGREGGEDGSEPPDEAEYPDAGYNGMTDPPEPGDDDAAIAEEMLGDLHALDKGLSDYHPAHLHHASHNPTQQQHLAHTTDEETHVNLPQTQAQITTELRLPPPPQTKPTPDTNPTPRKRPLNEITEWVADHVKNRHPSRP